MDRKDSEIEICAGNTGSVLAADRGGADRVELCENLVEGGTTPSFGNMIVAKEKCSLDVYVIIRPRGGDFVYSETEMEVMLRDIQAAVGIGADGIELLRELRENAGTDLHIMAGSGIDESNIREIALGTGLHSFHASLREATGEISHAGRDVLDNQYQLTNEDRVKALIKIMEELLKDL